MMVDGEFEGLQRICLSSCMITDHLANRYCFLQSRVARRIDPNRPAESSGAQGLSKQFDTPRCVP